MPKLQKEKRMESKKEIEIPGWIDKIIELNKKKEKSATSLSNSNENENE